MWSSQTEQKLLHTQCNRLNNLPEDNYLRCHFTVLPNIIFEKLKQGENLFLTFYFCVFGAFYYLKYLYNFNTSTETKLLNGWDFFFLGGGGG